MPADTGGKPQRRAPWTMTPRPSIVWFRQDLRLQDNPALSSAVRRGNSPITCCGISPTPPVSRCPRSSRGFPGAMKLQSLGAWQWGRTGYPLVDAGMRELWTTGWMHNRVRMAVASFLVKHLLIPWQRGAEWFWGRSSTHTASMFAAGCRNCEIFPMPISINHGRHLHQSCRRPGSSSERPIPGLSSIMLRLANER